MRGLLLAGLVSTLVLVVAFAFSLNFFFTDKALKESTTQEGIPGSIAGQDPMQAAATAQELAELKNIQVALAVHYAEYGVYPATLDELVASGALNADISKYTYTLCQSGSSAVVVGSSQAILIEHDQTTSISPDEAFC
jgi:hypothetical protein